MPTPRKTTDTEPVADQEPTPEDAPVQAADTVVLTFEAQCPLVIDGFGELEPGAKVTVPKDQAPGLLRSPFFRV